MTLSLKLLRLIQRLKRAVENLKKFRPTLYYYKKIIRAEC